MITTSVRASSSPLTMALTGASKGGVAGRPTRPGHPRRSSPQPSKARPSNMRGSQLDLCPICPVRPELRTFRPQQADRTTRRAGWSRRSRRGPRRGPGGPSPAARASRRRGRARTSFGRVFGGRSLVVASAWSTTIVPNRGSLREAYYVGRQGPRLIATRRSLGRRVLHPMVHPSVVAPAPNRGLPCYRSIGSRSGANGSVIGFHGHRRILRQGT
jgi:hypothetical protein